MADAGATVVGVDWRTTLTDAAGRVRPGTALQGNLDPVVLMAGWDVVRQRATAVVEDGRAAVAAGAAATSNLGHGVMPATDPGVLTELVAPCTPRERRCARGTSGRRSRSVGPVSATYCVVGGGISGLAAAYRLRRAVGADATITVFDPADRLGGILRTERVGGQSMDIGAEAFVARAARRCPHLLAELGLAERRIAPAGTRPLIYAGARLHPLPAGTVNGIPSAVAPWPTWWTRRRSRDDKPRPFAPPALADRRRSGRRRPAGRPVRRAGGGPLGGPDAARGLRGFRRRHRPAVGGAVGGRGTGRRRRESTDAVRSVSPPGPAGPVFGAVEGGYQVVLDALIARSGLRWQGSAVVELARHGGGRNLTTTRAPGGPPTG